MVPVREVVAANPHTLDQLSEQNSCENQPFSHRSLSIPSGGFSKHFLFGFQLYLSYLLNFDGALEACGVNSTSNYNFWETPDSGRFQRRQSVRSSKSGRSYSCLM